MEALNEYFSSEDVVETIGTIKELGCPEYHYEVPSVQLQGIRTCMSLHGTCTMYEVRGTMYKYLAFSSRGIARTLSTYVRMCAYIYARTCAL